MRPERRGRSLFSDWPAKVLSLATALLLTLFFNLTRLEQRTMNIPLTISLGDSLVASSQYPRTVRVVLRGERDTIYGIREEDISASLDLTGFRTEGVYKVPIILERHGNALTADPLETRAEPSEIALGLERKTSKMVPITPSFKGFLESGYEITSFDLVPREIVVSGPAGVVAQTSEVATDTIELGGKRADFSVTVRLLPKNSLLTLEGKNEVLFSARVRKSLEARIFDNLRIAVRGLAPSLALADTLPQGTVKLHVPSDFAKEVDTSSFLSIDMSDVAKAGVYTVAVSANPPPGAVVESYEPQSLTIRVQAAQPAGQGESKP